ncbi:MAG: TVP38/TMEM64 family protein [Spirochaetota bacterium]
MNKILKRGLMICIPVFIVIIMIIPATREYIFQIIKLFSSVDIEPIKEYIRSFGPLAVAVSFMLMVFQSVIAPLPAFLITFSNAAVFGWGWGALLSWSSAMAGAALCFGIAKLYGRSTVAKLTGKTSLKSVDKFFEKFGTHAILIARLLPFVPFDIISYGAGLTSMRFRHFIIATGLGQLPATVIYSYAGDMLAGGAKTFVFGLLIVFAFVALTILLRSIFTERIKIKKEQILEATEEE